MKQNFEVLYYLVDGERLSLVVVRTLSFPLDFHDATFSASLSLFKV